VPEKLIKRPTRNQIAEKAGVSAAVVSFVLNNSNYVKASTRERVLNVIKELQYKPNLVARSLRKRQTNHLTLLGSNLLNPVFAEMAHAMSDVAYPQGYFVSVCNATKKENIDLLLQSGVAGIVIASDLFSAEELNEIASHDIAIVLFKNRNFETALDESIIVIEVDLLSTYRKIVKAMVEAGRKKVLYLSAPRLNGMQDRNSRFCDVKMALGELDIPLMRHQIIDNLLIDLDNLEDALIAKCREVKPDFIITSNDECGLETIAVLKKRGIRIPDDIAVNGCDNIKSSEYITPRLSTIDIHKELFGVTAAQALIDRLHGRSITNKITIPTEWIRRESVWGI
jgi:DNA-binding LacI/PurR family transcriptional regulator